jgi:meckelin
MDLCSVANISVIIMDTYLHGFYIHGEAPWISSDLVLSELKKNLDRESDGKTMKRGISDKYPNH